MNQEIEQAKSDFQKTLAHFEEELKKIRTGRANATMLDSVMVEAYGQSMPLKTVGNIVAIDAQMLQITPFDPSNLAAIAAAIREDQSLGLNPSDDGKVVRVAIPPLTTERRQEITKQVGEKAEEARIAMRNARHDTLKKAKQAQSDKAISEDDYRSTEKQLTELIDEFNKKIDASARAKEAEIMQI